ncbi:DUF881 domain-containing protein [Nocardioides sp. TRM66260-LWL]|uniref:DUF881 domain-containing protein n=1 Tax=Nocardioides sp. TRM66260-LWL TaxID=2874478 RepID=UPI001CC5BDFD|nr:DUF881 domain-containing protein [Nocardioides sp. TRM66260-LWL]MBZ5734041.1 DUF881 domain-containing protein [Nocardioides sp. TRM66260-LWL]
MSRPYPVVPPAPLPARVTTPLLTLITQQSLDEDYLHAAERRAARAAAAAPDPQAPPADDGAGGSRHLQAAAVLALFGLLLMTAVIQTARNADSTAAGRATLISRIDDQRRVLAREQERIQRDQDAAASATDELTTLRGEAATAQGRLRRLQVRTGYLPVAGPGVRLTVRDAPDDGELVRDTDLRRLVDGLWEAGAEAIAINGQRLSVLSAIRNSGQVVNVNYQPLRAPYVVSAIGDPKRLQADLLDTESGAAFIGLTDQYGFGLTMQNVDDDTGLRLPAAPARTLRWARQAPPSSPAAAEESRS